MWCSFFSPTQTERLEWHQFQCDLQVAVSVADRLRVESEQALGLLQESHKAVEERLARVLSTQQDKDRELESLRVEHRDICRQLNELTLQQQQQQRQKRAEPSALRSARRGNDVTDGEQQAERRDSEERQGGEKQKDMEEAELETEAKNVEKQQEGEHEAIQDVETKGAGDDPEEENGSGSTQLKGKGVAEGYLRSLAALEKKKEEGRGIQERSRRIVMLSERSW